MNDITIPGKVLCKIAAWSPAWLSILLVEGWAVWITLFANSVGWRMLAALVLLVSAAILIGFGIAGIFALVDYLNKKCEERELERHNRKVWDEWWATQETETD